MIALQLAPPATTCCPNAAASNSQTSPLQHWLQRHTFSINPNAIIHAGSTHTAAAASPSAAAATPPLTSASAAGPTHAAGSREVWAGGCSCHVRHVSHKPEELNGRSNADASTFFNHALRSSSVPARSTQHHTNQRHTTTLVPHLQCTCINRTHQPAIDRARAQPCAPATGRNPAARTRRCRLQPLQRNHPLQPLQQNHLLRQLQWNCRVRCSRFDRVCRCRC